MQIENRVSTYNDPSSSVDNVMSTSKACAVAVVHWWFEITTQELGVSRNKLKHQTSVHVERILYIARRHILFSWHRYTVLQMRFLLSQYYTILWNML